MEILEEQSSLTTEGKGVCSPSVSHDDISTIDGFARVASPPDVLVTPQLRDTVPYRLGALVRGLGWGCDAELVAETRVCDEHVVENICGVANVGHCEGAKGGERLVGSNPRNLGRVEKVGMLMQGEYVCEGLSGVPEGRKCIEYGDGGVFCEFLRGR